MVFRDGRGVYANAGPTSLPGPGSSYITGSPRNLSSGMRRDSLEQGGYARYPSGGYEGPHSLPYPLQHNYSEGTLYQVPMGNGATHPGGLLPPRL